MQKVNNDIFEKSIVKLTPKLGANIYDIANAVEGYSDELISFDYDGFTFIVFNNTTASSIVEDYIQRLKNKLSINNSNTFINNIRDTVKPTPYPWKVTDVPNNIMYCSNKTRGFDI